MRSLLGPLCAGVLLLCAGLVGDSLVGSGLVGGGLAEASDTAVVRARAIDLQADRPERVAVGRLRYEAGFVLTSSDDHFGGLSGLWIAPDGSRLIAVSDRAWFWSATLQHASDGRLIGLAGWSMNRAQAGPGDPKGRRSRDAEALASDGDGGLVVAFEGRHRLRRFALDDLNAPPSPRASPTQLRKPHNNGIETLVRLPDGALLALAEGMHTPSGDLAGWRIEDERIAGLSYRAVAGFVPTGADRLGDDLYVVERRLSLFDGGFATRLVTLPAAAAQPDAQLDGQELARLRRPLISDNFEGIAVRRGPDGRVLIYLVSDDNFNALQRTLLLQFSLVPPS